jgi:hypothetical protein
MINNQIKSIKTKVLNFVATSGSGKNTLSKTGRAAIIGALIDGSDGAKTGAKVGAGLSLITRGGIISIKSGTLLDVPLSAPLIL